MRIYQFDTLSEGARGSATTLRLQQRFSHGLRRVRAAVLAGTGLLVCAPFLLILTSALARSEFVHLASQHPLDALQLLIAAAIGVTAASLGVRELLRPLVRRRLITLDDRHARVTDITRRRTNLWREPLECYKGIRHRVETRSSGPVHLLMLEHSHPSRSICIAYGTHMADHAIVEAARRFDLPVLGNSEAGDGFGGLLWFAQVSLPWRRPATVVT